MNRLPFIIIVLIACRLFAQQSQTLSDIIDSVFPQNRIRPCTIGVGYDFKPVPSLTHTRWDSTEIEAWVKQSEGCRAVTIRKESDTRFFDICRRTIKSDSIFFDCMRAVISGGKMDPGAMYITSSFSFVTNSHGDTLIRRHGHDEFEELGALDSCSNARLRFTGKIIAAAAQCMGTDTIIHQATPGKADTCTHCFKIVIIPSASDIMLGSAHGKKILLTGKRDSAECNMDATRRAIKLINDELTGKRFVIPSFYKGVFGGVALFSSRRACECDSVSGRFPGGQ